MPSPFGKTIVGIVVGIVGIVTTRDSVRTSDDKRSGESGWNAGTPLLSVVVIVQSLSCMLKFMEHPPMYTELFSVPHLNMNYLAKATNTKGKDQINKQTRNVA